MKPTAATPNLRVTLDQQEKARRRFRARTHRGNAAGIHRSHDIRKPGKGHRQDWRQAEKG